MTEGPLRAIVFDIDGVLLELAPGEIEAFVGAFDRCFGITGIDQDWNSYKKRNDIEIAREILARHFAREPSVQDLARVLDDYVGHLGAELAAGRMAPTVMQGAREAVGTLAERSDLCLALASANLRAAAELRLGRAGLWPSFHCGGFAEDGTDKTETLRAVIAKCAAWSGRAIRPQEVLFLGDQPSDVRAARANGTRFIGVAEAEGQRRSLQAAGAETIIPRISFQALRRLL